MTMSFYSPSSYENHDFECELELAFSLLDHQLELEDKGILGLEKLEQPQCGNRKRTASTREIMRGGVMHRFMTDAAIAEYCAENYLDAPKTNANGKVEAWCEYRDTYIQIGWIH
jgi:hypothetical protein